MGCISYLKLQLFSVSFLWIHTVILGYQHFQNRIPNGKFVPHPCKPNYVWQGVGHVNPFGGGERNPFGQDWEANGMIWDECLCNRDSDGDGRTNGEELGDPDCVWSVGQAPNTTIGLSHPGICEPLDSKECQMKNDFDVDCSYPEFMCDAVKDEDVKSYVINLSETQVPAERTTYVCQLVKLPDDGDFHIIATEPYLANPYVIHHIIALGCTDKQAERAREKFSTPSECAMDIYDCTGGIGGWTLGQSGHCFPQEYGMRIGSATYKHALIQLHWNNPNERTDFMDSSGLTLHYTPNLRQYDASSFYAGPYYLELPPGEREVRQHGRCHAECTKTMFPQAVNLAVIIPHMHYLGRGMIVDHKRNGLTLSTLVNITGYSYDNPLPIFFEPPVMFLPGDELAVTCVFETSSQQDFVFFGEEISDEMCLATVRYYPKQDNVFNCLINNEVGHCGRWVGNETFGQCFGDALLKLFSPNSTELADMMRTLAPKCDPSGMMCWEGCRDAIRKVREHPCLRDGIDHLVYQRITNLDQIPNSLIYMMASCDPKPMDHHLAEDDHHAGGSVLCDTISGSNRLSSCFMEITLLVAILLWSIS